MVTRGRAAEGASAGRRGRRTLRFARGRAVTGACPSSGPAGPPSPKGEGKGCCWRQRKPPRGIGDAAPCGLPGDGRQREPAPHPALRGHLPPRGKARAVVGGSASLRGASGTPPPAVCPGTGGSGSLPLIRPCGATFPQGGRQGLLLAAEGASAGRRGRRPYGLPGDGRRREPAPHPALRGHLPPRGKARAVVGGGASLPLPRQLVLGAELEGQAVVPAV